MFTYDITYICIILYIYIHILFMSAARFMCVYLSGIISRVNSVKQRQAEVEFDKYHEQPVIL